MTILKRIIRRKHHKNNEKKIVTYCCCVIMLFADASVLAQKTPSPPEPKPAGPAPPGLPIDGGLSYLFIVGAAYGVYAIRKKITIDD